MESYCLKCKKHTKSINLQVSTTSNGKIMTLSKCATLSKLSMKTLFSKLPILGHILF